MMHEQSMESVEEEISAYLNKLFGKNKVANVEEVETYYVLKEVDPHAKTKKVIICGAIIAVIIYQTYIFFS